MVYGVSHMYTSISTRILGSMQLRVLAAVCELHTTHLKMKSKDMVSMKTMHCLHIFDRLSRLALLSHPLENFHSTVEEEGLVMVLQSTSSHGIYSPTPILCKWLSTLDPN